jgi:hypothetical protein
MGGMPQLPKQQTVERTPYQSELDYFKANPTVAGMATEDNRVIINPYSNLTKDEKNSVFQNEKARIIMRTDEKAKPRFLLTDEQKKFLDGTTYKNAAPQDRAATIAARILTGDPSAGKPTKEQLEFVNKLKKMIK